MFQFSSGQCDYSSSVLLISTDDRRKASAISLRDVSYFFPKLKQLKKVSFKPLVDTVGYSTQTSCLLQILLKPLPLLISNDNFHLLNPHILFICVQRMLASWLEQRARNMELSEKV